MRSLTGSALASQVGVSQGYISDIENGRRRLSSDTAEKIAAATGLTPQEFLDAVVELAEKSEPPVMRLAEDPAVYGRKIAPPAPTPERPSFELLARQLVAMFPREKAFDLVRDLTNEAERGDTTAAGRAQALLYILTTP